MPSMLRCVIVIGFGIFGAQITMPGRNAPDHVLLLVMSVLLQEKLLGTAKLSSHLER